MDRMEEIDFARKALDKQLNELLGAEQLIVEYMPAIIERCSDEGLRNVLRTHYAETLIHVSALRGIFKLLEQVPSAMAEESFREIVNAIETTVSSAGPGSSLDLAIISGCKEIEHYEIHAYSEAAAQATTSGNESVRRTLLKTLAEENLAQVKLNFLAKNVSDFERFEMQE
jgi:ferritin-like metal-binding protein YciE